MDFVISDPTIDHLDVRFGREVIFDASELTSSRLNTIPCQRTVEEIIPVAARRNSMGSLVIPRVLDNDTDGFHRSERL